MPIDRIETTGFAIIDRYLDWDLIERMIADLSALPIAVERAGIRNILELVPSINHLAQSETILSLIKPILGDRARVVRGIFFDKQPNANWKVPWHQDLTIAIERHLNLPDYQPQSFKAGVPHVQPPTAILEQMLTVRIHLDRTDETNGALKVIPTSHLYGKLTAPEIERLKQLFPAVVCNCDPGGILLMRPLLLHASSLAIVPHHRRVIHLEYASDSLPLGLKWYRDR